MWKVDLQLFKCRDLAVFHKVRIFQSEQKRFLQQHKQRTETYSKAAAMMKKQRKKSRGSSKTGLAMDKELKVKAFPVSKQEHLYFMFQNMQVLEEEKTKLDAFCEQSLKNVSNLVDLKRIMSLYANVCYRQ